jgi:Aflatoxin regulatory protein/Fungal Zn(2)-Cys(6) binuclear cluster domain
MQQSSRARQRLKDSCNSCALAKVKCNREKPVCSRCQDRDLVCCYGLSHRSGRRRTASRILNNTVTETTTASNIAMPTDSCTLPQGFSSRAELSSFLRDTSNSSTTKIFHDPRSDEGNLLSPPFTPSALGVNMDIQASSQSDMTTFSYLDSDFPNSVSHVPYSQSFGQELEMLASASAGADQLATSVSIGSYWNPSPDMNGSASQAPGHEAILNQQLFSANSNCLLQALGLLAMLEGNEQAYSSTISKVTTSSYFSHFLPMTGEIPTYRTALESAMSTLKCPCSANNDQLIILVCFIGFRIMARYAATVREGHERGEVFSLHSADNPMDSNTSEQFKYQSDMELRDRAQVVLGELHYVDLLIEMLSQRFEKERSDPISRGYTSGSDDACISISIFAQLEADLRKRRRAIATDIMANFQCV